MHDVEGTYANWLAPMDASYVILRPDFYVAATAQSPEQLITRFDEVLAKLHVKSA